MQIDQRGSGFHSAAYVLEITLVLLLPLLTAGCLDPCNNCVSAPASGPGTFSKTGPLSEERAFASSAPLPDGTVLIAGGGRVPGYLTRAQIFDPASTATPSQFEPDAELENARSNHTATLLGDGHVLIAGGDNGVEALNSCEIYHPSSSGAGSFVNAASMFATRTHHTATLLKDGRVLMAGGSPAVGQGALNTAELFDTTTGNFTGVFDSLLSARSGHTATLLEDGTVLLVGGADQNGTALASAEVFDPHTQTFAPTIGNLSIARFDHTATLIKCGKNCEFDGDVLIAGGFDNAQQSLATAEVYDPSNKTFFPPIAMTTARALHTAIDLDDGSVLIAGGVNGSGGIFTGGENLNSAEVFDANPASMTFGSFIPAANSMVDMRSGAAAAEVQIGGVAKILVTFGGDAISTVGYSSSLASTAMYDPASMMFLPGPPSPTECTIDQLNPLGCAITRTAHTATTLADGRLLIVGGYEATAVRLASTEIYDIKPGTFKEGPPLNEPRVFQTSSVILNAPHLGDVVIAGGDPPCDGTAERYDAATNAFVMAGPMTSPNRCSFFSATPLADGRILYAGGLDINENVLDTAELYNPVDDSFTPTSNNLTTPRWGHAAVQLNDGTGDVLIIGGAACSGGPGSGCNAFLNTAELFNPTTGMFTAIPTPMHEDRFFASANNLNSSNMVADNGVLIAGGANDNLAELYEPDSMTFPFTYAMNFIRFFQTATTLPDSAGLILITGGSGKNAFNDLLPLSSAEIFNPNAGEFCGTGDMTTARAFQSATLTGTGADAPVLVAGGFGDNSSLGTAELYTPPPDSVCTGSDKAAAEYKSIPGASGHVRSAITGYLRLMSGISSER